MALRLRFGGAPAAGGRGGAAGGGGKPPAPKPGLGALLKKAFVAIGLKACGGCEGRAAALDRLTKKLRF